ncbi:MAG: hypothetical protein HY080_04040 [Gammaproteobacteria bacterium]|nr:hypothetical protein [Gammaproteobacteria bacterium]
MSDGLNLNSELFNQVFNTITQHDERGREDMLVNLQYLAAIAGYFCADYPGPKEEREELLAHLAELMKHICDDRIAKRKPEVAVTTTIQVPSTTPNTAPTPAKGKSTPTADPAVGIWQPE